MAVRQVDHSWKIVISHQVSCREHVAADPFMPISNAKKLQGRSGYRLRVGDWRVIYEINKDQVVIIVMKIAPGGEVYK